MLTIKNLSAGYGKVQVLHGISLEVPKGQAFCRAGADVVTFHPEASAHVDRTLQLIKAEGKQAGLVFNPDLLLYGDVVLDTARLTLPHPRLGERAFVLRPLMEIAPELAHLARCHDWASQRIERLGPLSL